MKIHKIQSYEHKGDQQAWMVYDCIYHWSLLNNAYYTYYTNVMNMKTLRWNDDHDYFVALTYHHNPNKW